MVTTGGQRAPRGATAPRKEQGSEGSQPHERFRDETSPEGSGRGKPSGGYETLKTERNRVRQTRAMCVNVPIRMC
jgi:hypothetical protein